MSVVPGLVAHPAAPEIPTACAQSFELRLELVARDHPLPAADSEPIGRPATLGHLVCAGPLRHDHVQVVPGLEVDVLHDDVPVEAFEQGANLGGRHVEPHVVLANQRIDIGQDPSFEGEHERVQRASGLDAFELVGELSLQPFARIVTTDRYDCAVAKRQHAHRAF